MPSATPLQGWPVPGGSDAPANSPAFAAALSAAEKQSVMVFADATARDALILTANRKKGMVAFLTALGAFTRVTVDGGPWGPLQPLSHLVPGSSMPGITVANTLASVDGMITKTGASHFFTSLSFGNEYSPSIVFTTPFPNAILSVTVTQVHNGSVIAYGAAVAVDIVNVSSFRVLYPGGSATTERGYLWTAIGY